MAITVDSAVTLTGLEGNILRILEYNQQWKDAHVSRDTKTGMIKVSGQRHRIIRNAFHGLEPDKNSPIDDFSGDLDRMTIKLAKWDSDEIYSMSDGYGTAGYIPPQGKDWSGIRDSTDSAIARMFKVAIEQLEADTCPAHVSDRSLRIDVHGHKCGRKAKYESFEETWRSGAKADGKLPRLYCKQHSPKIQQEKESAERKALMAQADAKAKEASDRRTKLSNLAYDVQEALEYRPEAKQKFMDLLEEIQHRGMPYGLFPQFYPGGAYPNARASPLKGEEK